MKKYFFWRPPFSRFLAQSLRRNKIVVEKRLKLLTLVHKNSRCVRKLDYNPDEVLWLSNTCVCIFFFWRKSSMFYYKSGIFSDPGARTYFHSVVMPESITSRRVVCMNECIQVWSYSEDHSIRPIFNNFSNISSV